MRGHANLLGLWFIVENVGDVPASCAIMREELTKFAKRYPKVEFMVIDTDSEEYDYSVTVETVPGSENVELSKWDLADEGYGSIEEASFPHGKGLIFNYGGSPLNSAFSIYVVPLHVTEDGWVSAVPVRQVRT